MGNQPTTPRFVNPVPIAGLNAVPPRAKATPISSGRMEGAILGTTADTANAQSTILEELHPLARMRGPLATSTVFNGRWLQATYVLADLVLVSLSFLIVVFARFLPEMLLNLPHAAGSWIPEPPLRPEYLAILLLEGTLVVLFCQTNGLYRTVRTRTKLDESTAVVKAVSWATLLLTASIYLSGTKTVSRLVVIGSAVLSAAGLIFWRVLKRGVVERRTVAGLGVKNVLIIGAGRVGREVASYLEDNKHLGLVVRGFLDRNHVSDPDVLGQIDDLPRVARSEFVDEIIIAVPDQKHLVKRAMLEARRCQLDVKLVPQFYAGFGRQATMQYLGEVPVMAFHQEPIPVFGRLIKRASDIFGSLLGLVLLSPLLIAIATLIKRDSPGPVLYPALRTGKKGRHFVCYKFRTMVTNADEVKEQLRAQNQRKGPFFKITNDPRITPAGALLRKYSLDELPQLWNVLKGEMSLVGPRPHPLDDVEHYDLEHMRRLDVTPGLTGLWQVTARRDASFENAMVLDLEYIESWNLWLDIKLLLKTVLVVVKGLGQ